MPERMESVPFQFPREVAQGTTNKLHAQSLTFSFNTPEKWLRGLLLDVVDNKRTGSFNSPEKWLRGLLAAKNRGTLVFVSIPPRSGSGDYQKGDSPGRRSLFQFPREVAQGTTKWPTSVNLKISFNSPEKWLRGLRAAR